MRYDAPRVAVAAYEPSVYLLTSSHGSGEEAAGSSRTGGAPSSDAGDYGHEVSKVKDLSEASKGTWLQFLKRRMLGGNEMIVRLDNGNVECKMRVSDRWESVDVSEYATASEFRNMAAATAGWHTYGGPTSV